MSLVNDEPTGQTADIDVDALMNEIEAPSAGIPMNAAPEKEAPPAAEKTAAQVAAELEFNWNEKQIKVPFNDPRVKQWAAQGYDYNQRMQEFNQRQTEFEAQQKAIKELESRYSPVDEYVKQNPDWWNHVQSSWEQREQMKAQDPNNPFAQEITALKQQLKDVIEFKNQTETEKQAQKRQEEDSRYKSELESLQKSYPDLDFSKIGEDGKTLEMKIIEHGMSQNIHTLRAAFRDFYHDKLQQMAETRGKETVNKDIQKRTKLGLLGTTPTPRKGLQKAEDVKAKSYEDLTREALEELGIA